MLTLLKRADPSRDRLKAALASKAEAQAAVGEKQETYERLVGIVDASDCASRIASDAAREAKTFRTAWARNGCQYSETVELQAFETRAAESAKAAETATLNADAVRKELGRAQSALESAAVDLRGCDENFEAAIGVIISEESAELLAEFEKAAERYRNLRAQVYGVLRVLEQPWSLATKNKMNPCHEGEAVVEASLERAAIKTFHKEREGSRARDALDGTSKEQEWMDGLSAPWRARVAALRGDPNAT